MHEEPEIFEDANDKRTFALGLRHISKIEGHAALDISVVKGKVDDLQLRVTEGKRFYTQGVRGLHCTAVSNIVSRICGTCSMAHMTCCVLAVENALGIEPSGQTQALRELAMYGLNLRDHALHLYFFSMPDLFDVDSILKFEGKRMKYIEQAFKVKSAGNRLSTLVAGKPVHPTNISVGVPKSVPLKEQCAETAKQLKAARDEVLELIGLFHGQEASFSTKTRFIALDNARKKFSYFGDELISSDGETIKKENYINHLQRVVLPYSQATGFVFEGNEYMVGALARMNLNRGMLHKDTLRDVSRYLKVFPTSNIFYNNLAQAIEMLNCIDQSVELLEAWDFKAEPAAEAKMPVEERDGIAAIEAPRGTLYYMMHILPDGKVKYVTLVIPTAQNQVKISRDIKEYVEQNISRLPDRHDIAHGIERLIRAYDPCMSCATHFLKVNWKIKE